jgi:tetratricopeptide (TPR) repeat protein
MDQSTARSLDYQDFEIQITAEGSDYFAQVLRSPAGESARRKFSLPFDPKYVLLQLENFILRTVKSVRSNLVEGELHAIGHALFKSLLVDTSEIRDLYTGSRIAVGVHGRLRVKLRIDTDSVSALPWEFFYDDLVVKNFLGLHAQTSLVRYVQLARPVPQLKIEGPLRILGMAANPRRSREFDALDVVKERKNIDEAISAVHLSGAVHFQFVPGESYDDLFQQITRKGPWHVFHFIGHGGIQSNQAREEGYIVLADESGEPWPLPASKLQTLLANEPALRLVVLNCCDSARGSASVAKTLVTAGIPAVLAMQFPISDSAAIDLASAFYSALAEGEPVDGAVTRARIKMEKVSRAEWGVPVLYMRALDGRIFELQFPSHPASVVGAFTPAASDRGRVESAGASTSSSRDPTDRFGDLETSVVAQAAAQDAGLVVDRELQALTQEQLNKLIEVGLEMRARRGDSRSSQQLAKVYYELGSRFQKENSLSKAFVNISAAIDLDPEEPKYLYDRANIFARGEQFAAAADDMDRAIKLAPNRGDPHWAKGVICLLAARTSSGAEHLASAVECFTRAIACDSGTAKYYSSRGAAYLLQGRLHEALADLDASLRLDPKEGKTYYQRGLVRMRQGDPDAALQDFRVAVTMGYALAATDLQRLLSPPETPQ